MTATLPIGKSLLACVVIHFMLGCHAAPVKANSKAPVTPEHSELRDNQLQSSTQHTAEPKKTFRSYSLIDVKREVGMFAASTSTLLHIIAIERGASEDDIKHVLIESLKEAQKDPWLKEHPKHKILVRAYFSADQYRSNGQMIAYICEYQTKPEPEIYIRNDILAATAEPQSPKNGLSEALRQQIYEDVCIAESRAEREANAQHQPPAGQMWSEQNFRLWNDMVNHRTEHYKAEIIRKYGIDLKTLNEISSEGTKKDWPMPEWND